MKVPIETRKAAIYDKLHKFTVVGILGISLVTAVILGYNAYLFKKGILSISNTINYSKMHVVYTLD